MEKSSRQLILSELTRIFQEVLEDSEIQLQDHTTSEDIDDWDSLNHINLMLQVEKYMCVRFSNKQIAELENVGDLVDLILLKKNEQKSA